MQELYLLTLCLPLATILIVFGMRYFALIQAARARMASEGSYRQVAEQSVAVQTEEAKTLFKLQAMLGEIQSRLVEVEKILKAVE